MNAEQVKTRLNEWLGQEVDLSDWAEITQQTITDFGRCTGDMQWIHVDVDRATREGPFGGTIAHGFLLLSLLGERCIRTPQLTEGVRQVLNYGLDKVRWLQPVKSGSRVRNRMTLVEVVSKGPNGLLVTTENTLEIEGQAKPGFIAKWLVLLICDG